MKNQKLFNLMANSHDATLLESDMDEIVRVVKEMIIPDPSQLEAMAMKEFPVKMESIRNIRGYFDVDKNIEPRDIFLSGLQAAVKMMGGQG